MVVLSAYDCGGVCMGDGRGGDAKKGADKQPVSEKERVQGTCASVMMEAPSMLR